MNLVLVGLSHKTAPIEVRERIAFSEGILPKALHRLQRDFGLKEGMIVSTCNRVEILAQGADSRIQTIESVKNFLYSYHKLSPPFLEHHLYSYLRHDVIRHIFRVASSLDAMVIGEPQILAQLKQAYAVACETRSAGKHLNQLMPRAFFVAKRIRSSTRIGRSAVSVSSVAVELAKKIFGDLKDKSVLLLGAGEMAELAARSLLDSGIRQIRIANRTPEKAIQFASDFGGIPVDFEDLDKHLLASDIVLVSTGADSYILSKNTLDSLIRKRKYSPIFVIDIAVPRNVDPQVNELDNVFLYDIDDLQSVLDANLRQRQQEAEVAEEIVEEEVHNYMKHLSVAGAGRLISALRSRIEDMCLEELRSHQSNLDPSEFKRLEKILLRTAHKIAHPLITQIKQVDEDPGRRFYKIDLIRKVFQLEEDP